ncbi:MAG: double-strand break repair helicase AddA [Alphaproteobacteria bacterium]|nr:double-strand break repair helicase AddA [Alphaproteobacteria bacterium]
MSISVSELPDERGKIRRLALQAQGQASDPEASAWVGASAGTGKTRVLTERVLRLLLGGTKAEHILCLTFTKAAAAEMASRLARALSRWAVIEDSALAETLSGLTGQAPDADGLLAARQLFAQVLDAPGGVKIQTIHAFCQALLKRFPIEAQLAPHFTVLDERDALDLIDEAQHEVLAGAMPAESGPPGELAEALASVTAEAAEQTFTKLMRELTTERGRLQRLIGDAGGIKPLLGRIYRMLGVDPSQTRHRTLELACAEEAFEGEALQMAAEAMLEGGKNDQKYGALIADWLAAPDRRIENFERYESAFFTAKGDLRAKLIGKDSLATEPGSDAVLAREAERLARVRARLDSILVANSSAGLIQIGAAILQSYERRKSIGALLDYDDLILKTRELLSERTMAAWVLYKLDGGIDHILIDEAQDTNPDQWKVIKALTGEFFAGEGAHPGPRTVFAVGDVKQSIFGFQGADPDAFAEMRDYFAKHVQDARQVWRPVDLEVSFRSTSAILGAVDAVFADAGARDGVVSEDETIRHQAERVGAPGLVELWPPVRPRPEDNPAPWTPPAERVSSFSPRAHLAGRIAETVKGWIDNREILASRGTPIRAGDVMVLVRRRKGFVEELVRELKQRGVAVAGVDRMVLGEQIAVMDLMALGRFLLLPQDDLNLAALLKSPLVGLDEDQLFALAHGRGKASLWRVLANHTEGDEAIEQAHRMLATLLAEADFTPPFELYAALLEGRGGRRRLLARLGPEAEDAIDEFLNLALAYERGHTPSLQGFLHWIDAGEITVKRDLQQDGRNEVRVMTVHGAKGLQAPIVFLADTMGLPPTDNPLILWPGKDDLDAPLWAPRRALERRIAEQPRAAINHRRMREYRRLLYVAMTRAEDRLYVCGWETKNTPPDGAWYAAVASGLAGLSAPVQFDFGPDWKGEGRRLEAGNDAATVVVETGIPLDADPPPAWASTRPADEPAPPRPIAPSRDPSTEPPVHSPLGDDASRRFQRGLVIHRLLQTLPELPESQRGAACRRYLALPAHRLDADERAAIEAETLAVIEAPEHARLFGPNSLAEVPIVGVIGASVVSGQVDRLVVSEEGIEIVDYKTNRPPPRVPGDVAEIYLKQMAAYRAVLKLIYPDKPVCCLLLWTDGPSLMALDGAVLDDHAP